MVSVVPPGIDAKFSPAGPTPEDRLAAKSVHPLVVAVGRLVPVKQFDRLISAAAPLAALHPGLEIVVVGEGYERPALEAAIRNAGVGNVVRLVGRVDDDELVSWYRRAWLLVSTSAREGWGMTVTEAAACGTPSIASRIAGHIDAIDDGESGLLFDSQQQLVASVSSVLADDAWRQRLSARAIEQASRFTWDATALATFRLLAAEARRLRP
jgi:glycosyltransferase involved in cell wall biosynthesis